MIHETVWTYVLYLFLGLLIGVVNTIGGGGTGLLYPILIFLGMPPHTAVGTARLSILTQGFFGFLGFRSSGYFLYPFNIYVSVSAFLGSIAGSFLSMEIPPGTYKKLIAVVITLTTLLLFFGNRKRQPHEKPRLHGVYLIISIVVFFLLGVYIGIVQTGIGFMIMIALMLINKLDIHQANSVKVIVLFLASIPALIIFAWYGHVHWQAAIALAVGTSLGAYFTGKFSVHIPEKTLKIVIAFLVIGMAVKLWVFD